MEEKWLIIHVYDVDGGFGDAITQKEIIGYVDSEKEADEYIAKWSNERIYEEPYCSLECGKLKKQKLQMRLTIDTNPSDTDSSFKYFQKRANEFERRNEDDNE